VAGDLIPRLGLGTYGRTGEAGLAAILDALEFGYRHLDTAQSYGTEAVIGEALGRSGLRAEVFITTKVADTNLAKQLFMPSLHDSLRRLGVDQVDLTLIHWPSYRDAVPFGDYMRSLAEAKAMGLTRLIGVSNFTIAHLKKAAALLGEGQIVTNQVEVHPYLQNRKLREYCREAGIVVTAYMPLAQGRVAGDPVLKAIGERHGATAAAVSLAWLMQSGMAVIPASSRREHLRSNLRALSLTLTPSEMAKIEALDRNARIVDPEKAPAWD
jgi:2,5-diketo-D-gluconate reductase B